MRRAISLILCGCLQLSITLSGPPAWAAPGAQLRTSYTDGGSTLADVAIAMAASPDGRRIFATGTTQTVAGGSLQDYLTVAWDESTGEELWTRRFGRADMQDRPTSLAVAPDGDTVYVTGISKDPRGRAWTTVAYVASTGERRWVARNRLRGVHFDTFSGPQPTAVLASNRRVIVAGNTQLGGPNNRSFPAFALSYSPVDGHEIWRFRYSPKLYPEAQRGAIMWSATLNPVRAQVYLGIQVDERPSGNSEGVLALDAATGDRLWRSRYLGALSTHPEAIATAPDGSDVYVAGVLDLEPRRLLAFRARHGALDWDADLRPRGFGDVSSIVPSPDGNLVFATGSEQTRSGVALRTWAVDANSGELLWRRSFMRGSGSESISEGVGVTTEPDGSVVYVVGDSSLVQCVGMDCAWTPDIVTIAYDASTGTPLWRRLFGNSALGVSEAPTGIEVDPTGSTVSVAGTAPSPRGDQDFVLIAYSAA